MKLEGVESTNGVAHEFRAYCPFCDDKAVNDKTRHFYYNTAKKTGLCFRCGATVNAKFFGDYSESFAYLLAEQKQEAKRVENLNLVFSQGAGSSRFSALEDRHFTTLYGKTVDAFPLKDANGRVGGYMLRGNNPKLSYHYGGSGISYNRLTSSETKPLIIVEGGYDCLSEEFCAVHGMIRPSILNYFKLQHIVLFPDGDVFRKLPLLRALLKTIKAADSSLVSVSGVIIAKDGLDPDETENFELYKIERAKTVIYKRIALLKTMEENSENN